MFLKLREKPFHPDLVASYTKNLFYIIGKYETFIRGVTDGVSNSVTF